MLAFALLPKIYANVER